VESAQYEILSFPKSRLATFDVGKIGLSKHYMYCLLEMDVTAARQRLRQLRQQGQEVSFTAWMIKTIGDCIARNTHMHALLLRNNKVIIFEDVDIALPVESTINNVRVPLPLLIKATNRKTAPQVDQEIRAAIRQKIQDERGYILSAHQFSEMALKLYYRLPQKIRVFIIKRLIANPFRAKKHSGTVTVTTVNAVGTSGWILPTRSWHNLFFALGTVTKKAWVVEDQIQIREILNLTVSFNHDVIDGVPARKFMQELVKNVEKGEVRLE
jgi:hypothetical protein